MIDSFSGPYRWLSNFWTALVVLDGVTYPTVEHAYQAAKTLDLAARAGFTAGSAGEAKRLGRTVTIRPDWDAVKLSVMEDLVRQKFSDSSLRALLLATAPHELVEGNWWGDRFWGVCKGSGENHLGKILMRVRDHA